MQTIYTYDSNRRFSGVFTVDDKFAPVPSGLSIAPPEEIPTGMIAVASDSDWILVAEPVKHIDSAKSTSQAEVVAHYEQRIQALASGYSQYERESWPVQTAEATAYTAGPQAATPWLDAASAARGIDKAELAARVIAMDTAYRQIHGALTGHRQKLWDQINAAQTTDDIAAIDVTAGWPA